MKMLSYLAKHFEWQPFSKTLEEAPDDVQADGAKDAVVIFMQVEKSDLLEENYKRSFRKTLKHIKWLANKKGFKEIVLHSFAHLGGENAEAEEADRMMNELSERLTQTGYQVKITPFGWFCSWTLEVYGESLAKVWKEF